MDSRVIHCVKHPVEPSDSMVSSATGYKLVCSYNWKASQDLKIYIPGEPQVPGDNTT